MSTTDSVTAEIRGFVERASARQLGDDEDIFATGTVTSLFAMELVTFLESTFAITILNEDLELENFSTVRRMAELVARKRAA